MDYKEVRKILEETRDYKYTSLVSGRTICALRSKNHDDWHIKISPWTKEKVDQLISEFPHQSDKTMAKCLGLTIKQVQSKARKLGLRKSELYKQKQLEYCSQFIRSGPTRNQFDKGGDDSNIFYGVGPDHPNWIKDRSKLRHRRHKVGHDFWKKVRSEVFKKQNGLCLFCNRKGQHFDHIVPYELGGSSDIGNCQLLCAECHYKKTAYENSVSRSYRDKDYLKKNPFDPDIHLK